MKAKELRTKNVADLNTQLQELKSELMKLNAQVNMGTTPKSPGLLRKTKRSIAQVKTILHEKQASRVGGETKQ